jgi:hypothetical protein
VNSNFSKGSMQTLADDPLEVDAKSAPLGVSDLADDLVMDPLAGSAERKKFNAGSFILLGVVVLACAGLWAMRSLSHVKTASRGNTELEATIEKWIKAAKNASSSSALLGDGATSISTLTTNFTQRQVQLTNVQRNPFIFPDEEVVPVVLQPGDDGSKALAQRRAARQAAIEQAASRYELKSVIMSAQPLANVSGKIVRVGDELVSSGDNTAFRVAAIAADSVKLVAEDPALDIVVTINLVLKR